MSEMLEKNQAAFEAMKSQLLERFPIGHFVAFDDGRLVADADSFDALSETLEKIGKNRSDVFVIQVAERYPEQVFILL